jgi:hypothetical protein
VNRTYNCYSYVEKPYDPKDRKWPPDNDPRRPQKEVMDAAFTIRGYAWTLEEPDHSADVDVVALFRTESKLTHVALRCRSYPGWWESKLGWEPRIVHRLRDLEGPEYGAVAGYYVKEKEKR